MEDKYCGKHAKNIAKGYHRISHTKRVFFYYIHPQQTASSKAYSANCKLPINEYRMQELEIPIKRFHFRQPYL